MNARQLSILIAIVGMFCTQADAQNWAGTIGSAEIVYGKAFGTIFNSPQQFPITGQEGVLLDCQGACPENLPFSVPGMPNAKFTSAQGITVPLADFASASVVADQVRILDRGVAMSLAMAGVGDLQSDEHIAFSGNWGTFQGENGGAVGAAYRLTEHVSVNAGFAGSFSGGTYGGRAGIRIGW